MKTMTDRLFPPFESVLLLLLLVISTLSAAANGAPVKLFLDYMPGVSNWGPEEATGEAVVTAGDGKVEVRVQGLPHLDHGQYEVWLVTAADEEMVSIGTFNTDENGKAQVVLDKDFPIADYRLLVISVEPEPDPEPTPDKRRTIAGHFPNAEAAEEPGPSEGGTEARDRGSWVERLPVTGGVLVRTRPLLGWGGVGLALVGILLLGLASWQHVRRGGEQ